jgi:hypothetical protein
MAILRVIAAWMGSTRALCGETIWFLTLAVMSVIGSDAFAG